MLALLGAELVLTPAAQGMKGAIAKAKEIIDATPGAVMPQQFENPANPGHSPPHHSGGDLERHQRRGRHCRLGRRHRRDDHRRRRGSEGAQAERAHGRGRTGGFGCALGGAPGPHKIQGIGAGFVPAILDRSVIDEIVVVGNQTAFDTARLVARIEGIPVGISSGAAVAAAIDVGRRPENAGKTIVIIIPSFAERYLSTALFEGL